MRLGAQNGRSSIEIRSCTIDWSSLLRNEQTIQDAELQFVNVLVEYCELILEKRPSLMQQDDFCTFLTYVPYPITHGSASELEVACGHAGFVWM